MRVSLTRTRGRLATLALSSVAALVGSLGFAASAHAATATPAWVSGNQAIINYASNKCLQPRNGLANALVEQRGCNGSALQKWHPVEVGNGYTMIVNQGSGLCLDLQANSEAEVGNGTLVQVFFCSTAFTSEQWNRSTGSRVNHFQVWNRVKGICLDLRDRSSADGALLQVWSCKFIETAQEFRFVDAP